ncbi:hypothetical protein [Sediminibacillus massiliensis]|uniref:hypothetical protein n=1 Tax=Sediminibacillus massiliensis TaxID=1926277 RepID=UPI000988315E|nr:hypothetical protein [Sediminibacillus massiliensis]
MKFLHCEVFIPSDVSCVLTQRCGKILAFRGERFSLLAGKKRQLWGLQTVPFPQDFEKTSLNLHRTQKIDLYFQGVSHFTAACNGTLYLKEEITVEEL